MGLSARSRYAVAQTVRLSMKRLRRGPRISRYFMYRHLAGFPAVVTGETRALSISRSLKLCEILGLPRHTVVEANHPEHDMRALPFPDGTFDYVVSDQVLEHVASNPQEAIDETHRVLKGGGRAIHTTCFLNPIHGTVGDYWRFTPDALRHLCRHFARIVDVGGWGNPYVWLVVGLGLRMDGIPHATWHPLHRIATLNDPAWPMSTWVVAEK